jgi:hypothetical protein
VAGSGETSRQFQRNSFPPPLKGRTEQAIMVIERMVMALIIPYSRQAFNKLSTQR